MTDCVPRETTSAKVLATVLQLVHFGPELVRGMIQVAACNGEPCRFAVSFHAVFFQNPKNTTCEMHAALARMLAQQSFQTSGIITSHVSVMHSSDAYVL